MTTFRLDVDAYFKRIGFTGNPDPVLDTLHHLHSLHAGSIAFENLSSFMGEAVNLDILSLQYKLVKSGRGGYCFEQNLLFKEVLTELGFQVKGLAARVRWNTPDHVLSPRNHMLLQVDLAEGRYIADVGFGGIILTAPLKLETGIEQPTSHEPFRLSRSGEQHVLEVKLQERWKALYAFDLQEQHLPDYEVSNWYVSSHPRSQFVTGLMAARPDTGCRHALLNNKYSIYYLHGNREIRVLTRAEDMLEVLQTAFRIQLPDITILEYKLAQLIKLNTEN